MKRDWAGIYFGIIIGLSLGLILCNVLHAAETGGGTGRFEPVEEQGEAQGFFPIPAREWVQITPNVFPADRVIYGDTPLTCLATMETAMRAMEPYLHPDLHAEDFYDGCNYCSNGGCTALACPLGGNEVARLEWELKRAKQREDAAKQRAAALAQWELGKACWRKP